MVKSISTEASHAESQLGIIQMATNLWGAFFLEGSLRRLCRPCPAFAADDITDARMFLDFSFDPRAVVPSLKPSKLVTRLRVGVLRGVKNTLKWYIVRLQSYVPRRYGRQEPKSSTSSSSEGEVGYDSKKV